MPVVLYFIRTDVDSPIKNRFIGAIDATIHSLYFSWRPSKRYLLTYTYYDRRYVPMPHMWFETDKVIYRDGSSIFFLVAHSQALKLRYKRNVRNVTLGYYIIEDGREINVT